MFEQVSKRPAKFFLKGKTDGLKEYEEKQKQEKVSQKHKVRRQKSNKFIRKCWIFTDSVPNHYMMVMAPILQKRNCMNLKVNDSNRNHLLFIGQIYSRLYLTKIEWRNDL